MSLSIVIPAYNESYDIKHSVRRLKKFCAGYPYNSEIIIVNDGSTDDTLHILNQLKGVKILSYAKNKGKGYAIRKGCLKAKYKRIFLLDADLSVDPSEIYKCDDDPIILGERVQVRKQPMFRRILGIGYKILVFMFTGIYRDTQCPFKVLSLDKQFYSTLRVDGFAYDLELILKARKIAEPCWVKVQYCNNLNSKVTIFKTIQMFIDTMKIVIKEIRGRA